MSNSVRVQPDLKFIKELQAVGGDNLKKCYQCATCSVVCPLSPADNPYPRKEMVWAQWGLKDRLVNDIDIWLCHNCGTCSDLCPRGAKPGDMLAALRNMAYRSLAPMPIIGKWMSSSAYLPMLIALPAAIYLLIWIARAGVLGTAFPYFVDVDHSWKVASDGIVAYGGLFPGDFTIDPIFGAAFAFMMFMFYLGVKNLKSAFDSQPKTFIVGRKDEPTLLEALIDTLQNEVLNHTQFKSCGEHEDDIKRASGHRILMFAFLILMFVTGFVAVTHWGGYVLHFLAPAGHTPMALYNPVKIAANVGAVMMLVGLTWLTKRRMNLDEKKQGSNWYDWYLLVLIWVIALTGLGAEIFRLMNVAVLAYPTYYVHLVAVFMMFIYLPWSKLGHLVYRTFALAYAKKIGRIPMGAAK